MNQMQRMEFRINFSGRKINLLVTAFLFIYFLFPVFSFGQTDKITISGMVKESDGGAVSFANVVLHELKDTSFVTGTMTDDDGRFVIEDVKPREYLLVISYVGMQPLRQSVYVGKVSEFLDLGEIKMEKESVRLEEIVVIGKIDEVSGAMDKKTYHLDSEISQIGGSVLQAMQNLPGITVEDGKILLRGSDQITILIDGKQTALTGFGDQSGLDNLSASGIEKIEIINNPSARYDAAGNAGIVNIIMKEHKQSGFNGQVGLSGGLGSLWERRENLPDIRPQYKLTPKINPSVTLNYRKENLNVFVQADNLYTKRLHFNEYVTRTYDDGSEVKHQLKRNRNTNFFTAKGGLDWYIDDRNDLTVSAMFGSEKIIDNGDQPFFNEDFSERYRLWQFFEDELKLNTTISTAYHHRFKQAGHALQVDFDYGFSNKDECYFTENRLTSSLSLDTFVITAEEHVYDLQTHYQKPLKHGIFESGLRFWYRNLPADMDFIPGENTVFDLEAGGWATYDEWIPALYGNYVFETSKWETELGLRLEYVNVYYDVNPDHRAYQSEGYDYFQAFPSFRLTHKFDDYQRFSFFYNRRVDRPQEKDFRIAPKYSDAEIIEIGNPSIKPQFTNTLELGYRVGWESGYLYGAGYHRWSKDLITRISTSVEEDPLIYHISQNVPESQNSGVEIVWDQRMNPVYSFQVNTNFYRNRIGEINLENVYPSPHTFHREAQIGHSYHIRMNNNIQLLGSMDIQLSAVYFAPDIIPQGKIKSRFSLDLGLKKSIQQGRGEIFVNGTDLLNTMVIRQGREGNNFRYTSSNYYETQVIRAGYKYDF